METSLQLVFRNEQGKLTTINLANPKGNLTEAQITAAMDVVVQKNIFQSTGGPLVSKVRARLTSREVVDVVAFEV